MQIANLHLDALRFPHRAGELQDQGATASLIRELGDNYDRYHDFLAQELQRYGGRPDPDDFATVDDYFAAFGYLQEVVLAEAFLRNAHGYRAHGRSLDAALDPDVPLVDGQDRLLRHAG